MSLDDTSNLLFYSNKTKQKKQDVQIQCVDERSAVTVYDVESDPFSQSLARFNQI